MLCVVLNSWWWTGRPSETCGVIFSKLENCAPGWFYYRKKQSGGTFAQHRSCKHYSTDLLPSAQRTRNLVVWTLAKSFSNLIFSKWHVWVWRCIQLRQRHEIRNYSQFADLEGLTQTQGYISTLDKAGYMTSHMWHPIAGSSNGSSILSCRYLPSLMQASRKRRARRKQQCSRIAQSARPSLGTSGEPTCCEISASWCLLTN